MFLKPPLVPGSEFKVSIFVLNRDEALSISTGTTAPSGTATTGATAGTTAPSGTATSGATTGTATSSGTATSGATTGTTASGASRPTRPAAVSR